jgi:hypothetical protein
MDNSNLEKTIKNTIGKTITALCIGAGIAIAAYTMYKTAEVMQNTFTYNVYSMVYGR